MKKIYTNTMIKKLTVLLFLSLINALVLKAQQDDGKVKFGAYSRALQQTNTLDKEDTVNIDKTNTGHVLLDLGVNINPDKKTEIQAIIRLKTDMGGFYGASAQATLRQMYVKGIIGKFLNYQVGDLYMQLTPYTFFNNNSEGSVNEGTIFKDIRRDYTNYENLSNRGNAWWQQGAHADMSLAFEKSIIDTIRIDGFFLRNRTTDFAEMPSVFQAGGKLTVTQSKRLKFAFNYLNLYDLTSTASKLNTANQARNPVSSLEVQYKLWNNERTALTFLGEGGISQLSFKNDSVKTKDGFFYDAGLQFNVKPANLLITANYTYVDPNYLSAGAQSKRIDYSKTPSVFPQYGNDRYNPIRRDISIFDQVRDPSVYNAAVRRQLMSYNPIYGNAQPYGKATPNRTGLELGVQYKDSLQKVIVDLDGAYLSDIAGEGSTELRKFVVLKAGVDFNIHKFLDFKKRLTLTTGYRYESTNRGGRPLEQINLKTNLIDLGLEIETLKKLDLLLGAKMLMAKGNEFMSIRNDFNDVVNYEQLDNINVSQNLFAIGLKYRFSTTTYLTIQNHILDYKDKSDSLRDYSLNQLLILFNMNF